MKKSNNATNPSPTNDIIYRRWLMNKLCHQHIPSEKRNSTIFSNAHLKQVIQFNPTITFHTGFLNKNKSTDVLALEGSSNKRKSHIRKLTSIQRPTINHYVYTNLAKRIEQKSIVHSKSNRTQIYEIANDTIVIRANKSNSTYISNREPSIKKICAFMKPIIRNRCLMRDANMYVPTNDHLNTSLLKCRRVGTLNQLGFV
jgi:transcriptional regulator of NAD metabolism